MDVVRECELLTRIKNGDEAAYAELIDDVAPSLVRYLRVVLRDDQAAEDVAQESFVRAYLKLERLERPELFRRWLWKIARCLALDTKRKEKQLAEIADVLSCEHLDGEVADAPPVASFLELESVCEEVRVAVDDFPAPLRTLLLLRYREHLSYVEISERVGLTLVQVKARLARARGRLRSQLRSTARDWKQIRDAMS